MKTAPAHENRERVGGAFGAKEIRNTHFEISE